MWFELSNLDTLVRDIVQLGGWAAVDESSGVIPYIEASCDWKEVELRVLGSKK